MKTRYVLLIAGFSIITCASTLADTPLTIGNVAPGVGGPCYDDTLVVQNPPSATGTFSLPTANGTGTVNSIVAYVADNAHGQQHLRYTYTINLSGISAPSSHCIKAVVHFGTPHTCSFDVLVFNGSGIGVASASKATFGDVTLTFGSGCLTPGQNSLPFAMLSDQQPKTNVITIIDDYTNPASGTTNEARINVTAVVPDIPPNWAYAPMPFPNPFFQGSLVTNSVPMLPPTNGMYDFALQLYDAASNGLPIGPAITQQVQVVNGLFNIPMSFEPGAINWGDRYLSIAVRPSYTGGTFNGVGRLPLAPTPQALYAYSAGVVADISPNQAITSLNGITGNTSLVAGDGIMITVNPSSDTFTTITIAADQVSDRNKKTDFAPVNPIDVLQRVVAMPIKTWRFTNEVEGIRHLGPMAQDFKGAFGLGKNDTTIRDLDEGGVALAAIQGLNQKLVLKDADIEKLKAQNAEFQKELDELKRTLSNLATSPH